MRPPKPPHEAERLRALHEFTILDTPPEPDYDEVVALAAHICAVPMSLINLIDADRQWSKARIGVDEVEVPREVSFCAHTILGTDPIVVPDATADPRFADNPYVVRDPGVRFYAGAPLLTTEGYALGTLCVVDRSPRQLGRSQLKALRALSRQVIAQLELRRFTVLLAGGTVRLRELERRLEDLAGLAGRLREPLGSLRAWLAAPDEPDVRDAVAAHAGPLRRLVDDLLALVDPASAPALCRRLVDLSQLVQRAAEAVRPIADTRSVPVLCTSVTPTPIHADPARLEQALTHLLFSAVKYAPAGGRLEVFSGPDTIPTVRVRDRDVGRERPGLFDHFLQQAVQRPPGDPPRRGLCAAKTVFDAHRATVTMYDRPGEGTTLHVTFPGAGEPGPGAG
ncbi:GAF domain-containing sensor histidine kinase [Planosporangium sp. 12N6]|uniref:GAF domain-containing sensor histidine kinase n=1 Tax=Planosporangium spinosum TaxID=3402278 RepID=UPI003CF2F495